MFERGELLIVPYPFTDHSSSKRRPVLVITSPDHHGDFIAMPVTSRGYHNNSLPLEGKMARGELPKLSWVRTDRIITLNLSLVVKSFARCDSDLVDHAVSQCCVYMGNKVA